MKSNDIVKQFYPTYLLRLDVSTFLVCGQGVEWAVSLGLWKYEDTKQAALY